MRTGSTWIAEILRAILKKDYTPVVDGKVFARKQAEIIRNNLNSGKIQKQHHFLHTDILNELKPHDYKIITVVRNPRDILTSIAHFRMARFKFNQSVCKTIKGLHNELASVDMLRQIKRMEPGYSTRNKKYDKIPYIWTSYEWMKYNATAEIKKIIDFLDISYKPLDILVKVVNEKMFLHKGNPKALRRGAFGDWINHFDRKLIKTTQKLQEEYWERLTM